MRKVQGHLNCNYYCRDGKHVMTFRTRYDDINLARYEFNQLCQELGMKCLDMRPATEAPDSGHYHVTHYYGNGQWDVQKDGRLHEGYHSYRVTVTIDYERENHETTLGEKQQEGS